MTAALQVIRSPAVPVDALTPQADKHFSGGKFVGNHHRSTAAFIITLVLFLAGAMAATQAAAPEPDPLWERAVSVAKQAEEARVMPGMMEMKSTIKKKDGTVDHRGDLVYRINGFGEDAVAEVVSATSDGKDVTEKARAEEEKERERQKKTKADDREETIQVSPSYHPFDPEVQNRVTAKRLGPDVLDGRNTVVFSFTHRPKSGDGVLRGKAWLDVDTGEPIQVEVSPDPLPKHIDKMVTRVHFERTPEGWWVPARSEIEGEGGLLWIRRTFESIVRFRDFRMDPAPGARRQESASRPD